MANCCRMHLSEYDSLVSKVSVVRLTGDLVKNIISFTFLQVFFDIFVRVVQQAHTLQAIWVLGLI